MNKSRLSLNNRGMTFVEMMVVLAIIAILATLGAVAVMRMRLADSEMAKSNAEAIHQFLNYARLRAIGSGDNIVVGFDPTPANSFYYACIDANNDDLCAAGEQADVAIAMPDTSGGLRGVQLENLDRYGPLSAGFGTRIVAGDDADGHVATMRLSGTLQRNAFGVYYQDAGGTAIAADGMALDLTSPSRIIFRGNGTAGGAGNNPPGSIYMYLRKDADTSYHYAVNVNRRAKVELYIWAMTPDAGGAVAWRWKMVSTK